LKEPSRDLSSRPHESRDTDLPVDSSNHRGSLAVSVKRLWRAVAQIQGSPGSLSQPPIIWRRELKINLISFLSSISTWKQKVLWFKWIAVHPTPPKQQQQKPCTSFSLLLH